jgi:hypothetical protein
MVVSPYRSREMGASESEVVMTVDLRFRRELAERLSSLAPYPESTFSGCGIVICAGGAAYFTNAYVLIHVLRHHLRCVLPIEVWHLGKQEMSRSMARLLEELDVRVVDATQEMAARGAHFVDGWQLKPFAVMWCQFEQALLLDADQIPTRDPAPIFQWCEFGQTGAVLWPDLPDLLAENEIWEACGLASRRTMSVESGQLLIDKSRHWRALQVAFHLNERAHYYYAMLYGDKDTFLLAMLLTDSAFTLVPHRPMTDRGLCLYQRDFDGEPLFQHRTGSKWRYAGEQDHLPGFVGVDACDAALRVLKRKWNGLIIDAPERSDAARRAELRLIADDALTFIVPGQKPLRLALLAEGEIGAGRAPDRMNWRCEEADGKIHLVLSDAFGPRWRLAEQAGGRWFGCAIFDPQIEAFAATGVTSEEGKIEDRRAWVKWPLSGYGCLDDMDL